MATLHDLDVEVWPSGANFVLFRPRRRSGGEVWNALLHAVVACGVPADHPSPPSLRRNMKC